MDTLTVGAELLISASQPMHVEKFFPGVKPKDTAAVSPNSDVELDPNAP